MRKGTINKFLGGDNPGNFTHRDLNVGDIVFQASDPYGCVDKEHGQAIKFSDDSTYPYYEIPLGVVDWS
jgi:hypothetical protein